MHVLEHQHQGAVGHQPLDDGEQQFEQPGLAEQVAGPARTGVGVAGVLDRQVPPEHRAQWAERGGALCVAQVAFQRAQDVDHGGVGQPALLQVEALPDEDPGVPPAGVGGDLGHQP